MPQSSLLISPSLVFMEQFYFIIRQFRLVMVPGTIDSTSGPFTSPFSAGGRREMIKCIYRSHGNEIRAGLSSFQAVHDG